MLSSNAASQGTARVRKRPDERRAEILDAAARLALAEGLERITLRAVADRLGVRPGLISHYYPAAEGLVAAAFALAISGEREILFAPDGRPLERIARIVDRVESGASEELARLWLNARHLSRFSPVLGASIEEQEALDRDLLTALIEAGVERGDFSTRDPEAACIRILMCIDGFGAYVNAAAPFDHPAYAAFVSESVARELGLPHEHLLDAIARLPR